MWLHWSIHHTRVPSSAGLFVLAVWFLTTLIRSSVLVASHWLTTLTSLDSSLLIHKHWHAFNKKLEVVLEFFLVGKISPLCTLRISLTELLEATLVLSSLVLKLAVFFDLIVVDSQSPWA